ncbi:hypothetical protein RB195_017310 [Necator americanus]|uniref:Protein-tyrosine phosphatase n=1 Tax=Necator americanus TaxID=51031 RepID=A0ABR1C8A1_NECAM
MMILIVRLIKDDREDDEVGGSFYNHFTSRADASTVNNMFLIRRMLNMPGSAVKSMRNRGDTPSSEEAARIKLMRRKKRELDSKERTSNDECETQQKEDDPTSTQSGMPLHEPGKGSSIKRRDRKLKRAQVKVFVEATLRKGVNGLVAEFKSMKRTNDFTVMTEFVAQTANGRNRYKDVGCLDNRRVVLNIGNVSYIHANYVSTPNNSKRFICTQAPLPKTCPEFWCMVVQEKSSSILMLCNFIEQNAKKCAEYFPMQEGQNLQFGDNVTVTCKKQEPFSFPFETKVKVRVTSLEVNVSGQPTHMCNHYQWIDWPDRGVPEADLAPIAILAKLKESTEPIIVHCSAGIGRTGCMVLIQHAMELLHKNEPLLEINGYLLELRKQRNNSIQTEQQYLYVHQVILLYLKRAKFLDEVVYPYLDAFTKDYAVATKGF